MAPNRLTKEERAAKKAARQQNRASITAILATLKGKDIKKMPAKEKEDLLIVISDFLGISKNGIVQ